MAKYLPVDIDYRVNRQTAAVFPGSNLQLNLYYPSSRQAMALRPGHTVCRGRLIAKIFKTFVFLVLIITMLINIYFVVETSKRLQRTVPIAKEETSNDHVDSRQIKQVNFVNSHNFMPDTMIEVQVYSSRDRVSISVNGALIHEDTEKDRNRGIHVVVLNQATGSIMAKRVFDTYSPLEDEALTFFISMVTDGRIVIFAIKDEASFSLKTPCKTMLQHLGSDKAFDLEWRDMWAMITVKGGKKLDEAQSKAVDMQHWADPVKLTRKITLKNIIESQCSWSASPENERRLKFCNKYEGYGSVCNCRHPAPVIFHTDSIENNLISTIPVTVIASNRPHYLFRMLQSLLSAHGVNTQMVTVFVDGYYEEPLEVASLFGVRGVQHTPVGVRSGRITQHYKASLTATFNLFPKANYIIILEEDLDVSPDFFSYFSQTMGLLERDQSIYCVSAWNDHGYDHSCQDPSLLYRVETMPGLGWLIKRDLFKDELEKNWPTAEKMWDWDMWMRTHEIRKGRECIIPDVSRTYHFGSTGTNVHTYMQDVYFRKHTLNTLPHVKLKNIESLMKDQYEIHLSSIIQSAHLLNHTGNPCDASFVPNSQNEDTFVLYIKMEHNTDFTTWKLLAKCLHLWDLDVRGIHKLMWRFFLNGNHVLVIGDPFSPYSKYKPAEIAPIVLTETFPLL